MPRSVGYSPLIRQSALHASGQLASGPIGAQEWFEETGRRVDYDDFTTIGTF